MGLGEAVELSFDSGPTRLLEEAEADVDGPSGEALEERSATAISVNVYQLGHRDLLVPALARSLSLVLLRPLRRL